MIDLDPAFRHDLFHITIENRVQDHGSGIVAAIEINRHNLKPTRQFKARRLSQPGKQDHGGSFATVPPEDPMKFERHLALKIAADYLLGGGFEYYYRRAPVKDIQNPIHR